LTSTLLFTIFYCLMMLGDNFSLLLHHLKSVMLEFSVRSIPNDFHSALQFWAKYFVLLKCFLVQKQTHEVEPKVIICLLKLTKAINNFVVVENLANHLHHQWSMRKIQTNVHRHSYKTIRMSSFVIPNLNSLIPLEANPKGEQVFSSLGQEKAAIVHSNH